MLIVFDFPTPTPFFACYSSFLQTPQPSVKRECKMRGGYKFWSPFCAARYLSPGLFRRNFAIVYFRYFDDEWRVRGKFLPRLRVRRKKSEKLRNGEIPVVQCKIFQSGPSKASKIRICRKCYDRLYVTAKFMLVSI